MFEEVYAVHFVDVSIMDKVDDMMFSKFLDCQLWSALHTPQDNAQALWHAHLFL